MKSSLKKLRGLALHNHNHNHRHDAKNRKNILPLSQLDELAEATQDLQDMRDCYDSLLSAAAATANSAYEFAESMRDMGSCLLEKTALNDHEDTGKVLLMLGKMQFKLQKLIDNYRSHISRTITIPSESLLNEIRIVEEMKRQCDEKRDVYDHMLARYRERGRSKGGKGESFSLQQLQTARDEYDQEATLFVFRLKSLKQGQSRSLLTQAARHHAAQLCFFKKGVKSLETVEPHVKSVTEQQHIDYHFSGLEEEDGDEGDDGDDDDDDGYDENDDGELSFDYGQNEREREVSTSQNSMDLDQVELIIPKGSTAEAAKENLDRLQRNLFSFRVRTGSQSAPLFADNKPDSSEKLRQMRPSLSRKFSSYVLPTPVDAKSSISSGSKNPKPSKMQTNLNAPSKNMWHSSPLEQKKYEKVVGDDFSGPVVRSAQSVLKESNRNTASTRLPLPLVDGLVSSNHDVSAYSKKIKRHAFSGPLTSNPWPAKPVSMEGIELLSGPLLPTPIQQPPSSSPKVSPSASPPLMSSPKISELHELPRPPTNYPSNSRLLGLVGHSGPLVSRGQKVTAANNLAASTAASPLPTPPQAMARSFSIPSSGARVAALHGSRALESSHRSSISEDIASPPLTPIALPTSQPQSDG